MRVTAGNGLTHREQGPSRVSQSASIFPSARLTSKGQNRVSQLEWALPPGGPPGRWEDGCSGWGWGHPGEVGLGYLGAAPMALGRVLE